jgi:peptidyl-prolyl cis-trans isomerase D
MGETKADSITAYNKAKDIYVRAKKGEDFAKLAAEFGQDGTSSKGGDLGWFGQGQMVKPFENAVKNANKGDIILVSTEFGTHVIKVTENKSKKLVKAAIIERKVTPGSKTEENAYNLATKFANDARGKESFHKAANKMNLTIKIAENIKPSDQTVPGITDSREIVRWAYNDETKVGSVSDPKRFGDQYVVALLTKDFEEGYVPFEEVKKDVLELAKAEKKKQMLADKLKNARDKSKKLEDIAKTVGSSVNQADNVNFQNSMIPNLTNEPKLVGTIFGLKKNTVSEPIQGENGVYIVMVTGFNEVQSPPNFDNDRKMLSSQLKSSAQNLAFEALKKQADIKDSRYYYY